jgi:hypothetical protein
MQYFEKSTMIPVLMIFLVAALFDYYEIMDYDGTNNVNSFLTLLVLNLSKSKKGVRRCLSPLQKIFFKDRSAKLQVAQLRF